MEPRVEMSNFYLVLDLESKIVNVQEDVFIVRAAHHHTRSVSNVGLWVPRLGSATQWTQTHLSVRSSLRACC